MPKNPPKITWTERERLAAKPPERLTVSEWSEKHRILLPQTSAEPGPWRNRKTPYLVGLMDAFSNPMVESVIFCKASQIGGTEAIYNMLGYAIDQEPSSVLAVMPTIDLAEYVSRNRIQPMIEATESLRARKSPRGDDYTLLEMGFLGMVLSLAGANSAASLATRPIRYLFLDEVDKYPKFAGKEADPISLAMERTKTFWNRKIVMISTPTLESGNIWTAYEGCETKLKFYLPCPHCGHYQPLAFEQIKFPENHEPDHVRDHAWYECEKCSGLITDLHKPRMLSDGEWRDEKGRTIVEISKRKAKEISFHINSLYSPWLTWGDIASKFLKSKDSPELLQNFTNSWLALPWKESAVSQSIQQIAANKTDLPPLVCPKDTVALTCGIDPGQGGFWFVVLAWKRDRSPHLVHYGYVVTWDDVRQIIHENVYQIEGEPSMLSIWKVAIDTGGSKYESENTTMTEAAYSWIRQYGMGRVVGTKGRSSPGQRPVNISSIDKTPKGKPIPGGIVLYSIDTSAFKDAIVYRLAIKEGDPGRFTFHNEVGSDFIRHLTAEEKQRNRRGELEWVQVKKDNHWLDCCVEAFALADPSANGGIQVRRTNAGTRHSQPQSDDHKKKSWLPDAKNWLRK